MTLWESVLKQGKEKSVWDLTRDISAENYVVVFHWKCGPPRAVFFS